MFQALQAIHAALLFVINVIEKILLSTNSHNKERGEEEKPLITVSPIRARVLCPTRLGENDERFQFCQWCGEKRTTPANQNHNALLKVDEEAVARRFSEFRHAWEAKASQKSSSAASTQFEKFIRSRTTGRVITIEEAHPQDVVQTCVG